jgi:phosphoribosylanthranilate isomerase
MPRTRVKICGITRPQDALAAARAGADAIGIILHPGSRRFVDLETARSIIRVLPPYVTPVGLFVDAAADQIIDVTRQLGLRHVQLNGSEPVSIAAALHELIVLKAIRVDRATLTHDLKMWTNSSPNVRGIVLETAHTNVAGGSGVENDWTAARGALDAGLFQQMPVIAAGGLRPENVAAVIRAIRPWAVDVSSGVEEIKNQKSPALIEAFISAVASADR